MSESIPVLVSARVAAVGASCASRLASRVWLVTKTVLVLRDGVLAAAYVLVGVRRSVFGVRL